MTDENPNAFKLLIGESLINKYFKSSQLTPKEIKRIKNELLKLELKPRVRLIARELKKTLPSDYRKALKVLMKITREQKLTGFELWPATEFIQAHGLDDIDESLEALYELTQKFTAEFGIRPFINTHGDVIYKKLAKWKSDPSEHVRRWLSEGTRPRLPWGEKLQAAVRDPESGLRILEHLKFDASLYVRKSVGNHLNDIAKDHPELVVETLKQ
jgi:3-methyladenine DNA glycosylase AlkC